MIIEEGQSEFALPEHVDPRYATFGVFSDGDPEKNPQSFLYAVALVPPSEILEMTEKERAIRGIPTMFTIMDRTVMWWPTSDKKTIGRLEYMPPPKVL